MDAAGPTWKSRLGLSAHVKDKTIEDVAAVAGRCGAQYLEIVAERFWDLPDGGGEARWRQIKELLKSHGLLPTVHASYVELNLSSLNPHLREAALRQTLRCLELAAYLEAEFLAEAKRNYVDEDDGLLRYLPYSRDVRLFVIFLGGIFNQLVLAIYFLAVVPNLVTILRLYTVKKALE